MPSNQSQIIEQPIFTYSHLEKQTKAAKYRAIKQTKTIEARVKKEILNTDQKSTNNFFSKDSLAAEARDQINQS